MFPKPKKSVLNVKQTQLDYNGDIQSMLLGVGEKESERFSVWGMPSRTEVISWIQLTDYLLSTSQVVDFLINGDQTCIDNKDGIIVGVYLWTLTIGIIASVFLFYGVLKKNPAFLSIWLSTTKINICIWSVALIVFPRRLPPLLLLLQTKRRERDGDGDEFEKDVIMFNSVLWSLSIGFQICCCWVISVQRKELVYTASLADEIEMGCAEEVEVEAEGCQKALFL